MNREDLLSKSATTHAGPLFPSSAALFAGGLLLLLSVSAPPALAGHLRLRSPDPNSALSSFTGPFAQVTVNRLSSATATITFDSLTNGGFTYLMGDSHAADLNVNAGSFTVGSITGTNSLSGFTPGAFSSSGAAKCRRLWRLQPATGYVSVVPEPASLPMLGSGLLSLCGLGLIRGRRKSEAC